MKCDSCGGCTHCGGCGGCSGGAIELSIGEIDMLRTLSQIPFLPAARKIGDDIPVYLEEDQYTPEEYSLILQCLQKRGLISVDYDIPLKGLDYIRYSAYPIHGSFALTNKGQQVVELLDLQGMEGE